MKPSEIENELVTIIGAFARQLGEGEAEEFQDLARHSEWLVALEMFCTQLSEHAVPLNRVSFERISVIGKHLGLKPKYIGYISGLVIKGEGQEMGHEKGHEKGTRLVDGAGE